MNQDPLGLQAYVVQHENEGYVLVKDIERKRGNVRAVALYNPSDTICSFTVPMNILELGGKVKARDLVKHQDLPEIKGGVLNRELPPHSVLIYVWSPRRDWKRLFMKRNGLIRLVSMIWERLRKASYMLRYMKHPEA